MKVFNVFLAEHEVHFIKEFEAQVGMSIDSLRFGYGTPGKVGKAVKLLMDMRDTGFNVIEATERKLSGIEGGLQYFRKLLESLKDVRDDGNGS